MLHFLQKVKIYFFHNTHYMIIKLLKVKDL